MQDEDEIKDNIKQISNGGFRSLKLGGKKQCVGSCTKPSVHEGCKYGVNCQVLIFLPFMYRVFHMDCYKGNECYDYVFGVRHFSLQIYAGNMCTFLFLK